MHTTNLAKKYAEEQRQIREQQQKQHLQRLQREKEIERERDRKRQLERQKGQQKEIEEIEILSSSSSSSSSSSDDDDSDVQLVLPQSKPIAADGPAPSFKSSKEADKIKGVSWLKDKGKWRARLFVSGKNRFIGCFATFKAAAVAIQVVRKALDESGLSKGDKDYLEVFDSAKAKAKEAGKAADASGTYSLCFGDLVFLFLFYSMNCAHMTCTNLTYILPTFIYLCIESASIDPSDSTASPSPPTAAGRNCAPTSIPRHSKRGSGVLKNTPSGLKVPADNQYTGAPGTTRCIKTTVRGRACLNCAVPASRFCNLHGPTTSGSSATSRTRKRGPGADGWIDAADPGELDDSSPIVRRKKARSSATTMSRQQIAELENTAARHLGLTLPKKPKGATGSFMFYRTEQASRVAAANDTTTGSTAVSKIIGTMWQSLSAVEKSRYDAMAQNSRKEYKKALEGYQREFEEFKNANPEWQREYDRILLERTAAPSETMNGRAVAAVPMSRVGGTHTQSPPNSQPPITTPGSSAGPDEIIAIGLKDGTLRLDPRNEILLENVELVMATRDDEERKKSTSSYRRGDIGLQCIHCKHLSRQERARQALVFPRDISCFSNQFSNFRVHFRLCQNIGRELRAQLENASDRRSLPVVSAPRYCIVAAKILGLENDPNGTVRFSIDVPRGEEPTSFLIKGAANPQMKSIHAMPPPGNSQQSRRQEQEQPPLFNGTARAAFEKEIAKADARAEAESIFPCSQRPTTTDFNYLVIRQFSLCHRSLQEKRSRYPIGYPGICCVHCQTKMYFADSSR